ncbi:MAG TPA: hypothetical protein VHI13_02735 [Candidatus Kapabacteria bacterium]|nr:hypothetical protein [Candidatus Kapabacteria bacterium]
MRHIIIGTAIALTLCATLRAQDGDRKNVISYFAAGNTVDGQPRITEQNVLRFFPLYSMRDAIDTVIVSIYVDNDAFSGLAYKYDGGRYWEIQLPEFHLGQAIQRVEAEVRGRVPEGYATGREKAPKRPDTDAHTLLLAESNVVPTDGGRRGDSLTSGDVILYGERGTQRIRILYRNYKPALRRMKALDPSESVGIFRARYVPFALIGSSLKRPLAAGAGAIFEVGLAFGDQIVSGDAFVLPEFSVNRLGVAFAITDQLFSDSARVLAIALTYDFNSYGSLGLGANFPPGGKTTTYVSLGINRTAFQELLRQIQRVF